MDDIDEGHHWPEKSKYWPINDFRELRVLTSSSKFVAWRMSQQQGRLSKLDQSSMWAHTLVTLLWYWKT